MKKIAIWLSLVFICVLVSCAPTALQQAEEAGERLMELMPPLVLPADAEALGGGGGGGGNSVGSAQLLKTSLSLEELYDFYAGQLSAAGWKLVSEEQSGTTIHSTWEVTDKDGNVLDGTLDVTFGNPSSEITTNPEYTDAYTVSISLTIR